mmetsp:Transcript_31746/g.93160  ORF Transcript_31746/g.93160 Transcript_31746/m.93160 type:complete len:98 (+) Transcript_31746:445-738(+)
MEQMKAHFEASQANGKALLEEKRKCNALSSQVYQLEKQLRVTQDALDKERALNQRQDVVGAKVLLLSGGHLNRSSNVPAGKREKLITPDQIMRRRGG